MIHVAIVEDEAAERERLKEYLERFSQEMGEPVRIRTFRDGVGLVSPYQNIYDIVLLDVQMEILDGIRTAEKIREKDEDVILIFITNMVQYALKGYSVNALNFVLKPVSYFAFCEEMKAAFKKVKGRQECFVLIKIEDGVIRLRVGDLYYAEMENRKVLLHTKSGDVRMSGTLLKLEELLQDRRFFRCHSGYLVNLQHLEKIGADTVVMAPGRKQVPLSRRKKRDLELALMNYLGAQM